MHGSFGSQPRAALPASRIFGLEPLTAVWERQTAQLSHAAAALVVLKQGVRVATYSVLALAAAAEAR